MIRTLYKGSIGHFKIYLLKHANETYLKTLPENFPNIHKWISDNNVDNLSSISFWKNPQIFEAQIKQVIKFCTGQYMHNAQKHIFWPLRFPTPVCSLCTTNEIDTWLRMLLKCP